MLQLSNAAIVPGARVEREYGPGRPQRAGKMHVKQNGDSTVQFPESINLRVCKPRNYEQARVHSILHFCSTAIKMICSAAHFPGVDLTALYSKESDKKDWRGPESYQILHPSSIR